VIGSVASLVDALACLTFGRAPAAQRFQDLVLAFSPGASRLASGIPVEQELTEKTEDNLTVSLARCYQSFYPCCLSFLRFNHAVLVSFVAFCVKDNWLDENVLL
jgi:hypothetical protein